VFPLFSSSFFLFNFWLPHFISWLIPNGDLPCPRCGLIETAIHILCDFSFARSIWMSISIPQQELDFLILTFIAGVSLMF
jgi:hypothetical protein